MIPYLLFWHARCTIASQQGGPGREASQANRGLSLSMSVAL